MRPKILKATLFPALLLNGTLVFAQIPPRGFLDLNKDGINDWFCDANGDGINDVDNQPYQHNFQFRDSDGDGNNELFVDRDGDGVNDLATGFSDLDGDGWNDNIIDANHDWINDITGLRYNRRYLGGERYGYIWEEQKGTQQGSRADQETGLGGNRLQRGQQRHGADQFIDTDGDGINDNRTFDRHRQQGSQGGRRRRL